MSLWQCVCIGKRSLLLQFCTTFSFETSQLSSLRMFPSALSRCLFMLTCFGALQKGPIILSTCPRSCDCYDAPPDGITGNTATSVICTRPLEMLTHLLFKPPLVNTMVLQSSSFQHLSYLRLLATFKAPYRVISLVLEDFTPTSSQKNYIFQIFDRKMLRYLSVYRSILVSSDQVKGVSRFSWIAADGTSVEALSNLQVINIQDSTLVFLDESFRYLDLRQLHTLIIQNCKLAFIDRDAFASGKSKTLQKLILSRNQLKSLAWLTTAVSGTWSNLWYLDLSFNQLTNLPASLKTAHLPAVTVLNLANNRLLSLDLKWLEPWFSIRELLLGPTDSGLSTTPIYFTKENEWIKALSAFEGQIEAQFLVNALVAEFQYYCPAMEGVPVSWNQLVDECGEPFSYNPNRLYFTSTGKLQLGQDPANPFFISITGLDLTSSPSLDLATDADQYTAKHYLLKQRLTSTFSQNSNTLRVTLFSGRMWGYFIGQIDLDQAEIELILDQVTDFIEELQNMENDVYTVLVLWNYGDIVESLKQFRIEQVNERFQDNVLIPLLDRLAPYTALIGIELVSHFLADQFTEDQNKFTYPSAHCDTDPLVHQIAEPQLRFLEHLAETISLYSSTDDLPLGIGIDANCRLCLPFVLITACLPAFTGQFDFVSLHSRVPDVNSEPYSYVNYHEQPMFPFVPIYYVLEGGRGSSELQLAIDSVLQYSAGYFLVQK